jgi:hypothetical protein
MSLTSYLAAPSRDFNHAPFGAGRNGYGQSMIDAREILLLLKVHAFFVAR